MTERATPAPTPPALSEPTQHAHECLQRALLAQGGRYTLPNPYPTGWRVGPLGIELLEDEPPQPRLWLLAPWETHFDPGSAQPIVLFRQILASLNPAHRAATTLALTVAELPPPPLLDALERTLDVGVVACTSHAAAAGPRAQADGSLARLEALLRVDNALLSAVDPAAAWAALNQATDQFLEARSFQQRLQALTPKVVVTPTILAACVVVWLVQLVSGISPSNPSALELQAWGANAAMVTLDGEPWRLITAAFLHGGIIHLGINMWVLRDVGPLCERLFGPLAYATVYLVAVLGGGLASLAWHPEIVASVGASGGIFGLAGAILGFVLARRRTVPPTVFLRFRRSLGAFVVYNLIFGFAINAAPVGILVDNAGHLGGLVGGFVAGFLLSRPLEPGPQVWRRWLWTPLLALGLGGSFAAIQHSPTIAAQAGTARDRVASASAVESLQPLLAQIDQDWADMASADGPDERLDAARERFQARAAELRAKLAALPLPARFDRVRAALDDLLVARIAFAQAFLDQRGFEAAQAAEEAAAHEVEAAFEELFE